MKKITISCAIAVVMFSAANAQSYRNSVEKNLQELVSNKFLTKQDASWLVTSENTSSISGVKNYYFRQSLNGLEIYGTESSVHVLANGKELKSHNNFVKNLAEKKISNSNPGITAIEAVQSAANQLGYRIQEPLSLISKKNGLAQESLISKGGISLNEIPAKLMYQKLENGEIILIWDISIRSNEKSEWFSIRVNAENGAIVDKGNWITTCNFGDSHEGHDHSEITAFGPQIYNSNNNSNILMTGSYEVFGQPLENPLYGGRSIVADAVNTVASPYGWHDTNGATGAEYTVTRGNNVNAFKYGGSNHGYQPNGGASLVFHYPYGANYSNSTPYLDASLTNLFYWNNIIHDILYQYGFDEPSGNFQQNNYGKGGTGNDPVVAQGQMGFDCNAYFGTPPDGSSGVMEMYLCNSKDGSYDNLVMVHEYGHGISNRLTGGPANSNCLWNGEQMGEGWSDWYGLMLTMKASDLPTTKRGIGTYLFGQQAGGLGIRTYFYTTDMTVNPYTYGDVRNEWGAHGIGTIWATMLWDMTWALIDEYGFDEDIYNGDGGNNIAMALVTEGLRLQPCSPGFVDGRDAILAADLALFDGANQCLIWDVFARRGLGASASQGSSGNTSDGVEAFDTPTTASADLNIEEKLCVSEGIVTGLGGGLPVGGVYSGVGVTDNGNGTTFTFDTTVVGLGNHTITYSVPETSCGTASTDTDILEVIESLLVTCPDDMEETIPEGTTFTVPDYLAEGEIEIESNCSNGGVTVIQVPAPGTELGEGSHTIGFQIMDEYDNLVSCSFDLVIDEFLGVNEFSLNANSVKLYPNPTDDKVTIVNKSSVKINSATVIDTNGRLIQKLNLNEGKGEMTISLKSLPSGVYFIKLNSDKEEIIKSVIKK